MPPADNSVTEWQTWIADSHEREACLQSAPAKTKDKELQSGRSSTMSSLSVAAGESGAQKGASRESKEV